VNKNGTEGAAIGVIWRTLKSKMLRKCTDGLWFEIEHFYLMESIQRLWALHTLFFIFNTAWSPQSRYKSQIIPMRRAYQS